MISGNMVGTYSSLGKTFILVDESGNEITGVVTENIQAFDAKPKDVRINKTFVSDDGVSVGENTITYRTEQGSWMIMPDEDFILPLSEYNKYNYTGLQCMFAPFNTNIDDSIAIDKIVLNNSVFEVNSTKKISSVTKDELTKSINFNIKNISENPYFIYYFTYCQEEM